MRFTRSFCDWEDPGLFDRLSRELPGILLWALVGWQRLRRRGRLCSPSLAGSCSLPWRSWKVPSPRFSATVACSTRERS